MVLYHFCAAHMKSAILKNGLTLGLYPIQGKRPEDWPKCQWLTKDPEPEKQSWATRNLLSYSRTAYRLTVKIPDNYCLKKLQSAEQFVAGMSEADRKPITEYPGSENWYVYLGRIPPKWIIGCKRMGKDG